MIKTIAKGRRIEDKVKKLLEASGYIVDRKPRLSFRATYSPDLFTLFDLIAIKKNSLKFVQVKSSTTPGRNAARVIAIWLKEYGCLSRQIEYQVWIYIGGKLKRNRGIIWRVIDIDCDGNRSEVNIEK